MHGVTPELLWLYETCPDLRFCVLAINFANGFSPLLAGLTNHVRCNERLAIKATRSSGDAIFLAVAFDGRLVFCQLRCVLQIFNEPIKVGNADDGHAVLLLHFLHGG